MIVSQELLLNTVQEHTKHNKLKFHQTRTTTKMDHLITVLNGMCSLNISAFGSQQEDIIATTPNLHKVPLKSALKTSKEGPCCKKIVRFCEATDTCTIQRWKKKGKIPAHTMSKKQSTKTAKELNHYKLIEMEVHPDSNKYTSIVLSGKRRQHQKHKKKLKVATLSKFW